MTSPSDVLRVSKTTYVVLLKDDVGRLTLLADPGMNRPWSSKNKRLADFHAHECDGMACTWGEAFGLLLKENPNFEKQLIDRVARVQTLVTPGAPKAPPQTPSSPPSGTVLDSHGNTLPTTNS